MDIYCGIEHTNILINSGLLSVLKLCPVSIEVAKARLNENEEYIVLFPFTGKFI